MFSLIFIYKTGERQKSFRRRSSVISGKPVGGYPPAGIFVYGYPFRTTAENAVNKRINARCISSPALLFCKTTVLWCVGRIIIFLFANISPNHLTNVYMYAKLCIVYIYNFLRRILWTLFYATNLMSRSISR